MARARRPEPRADARRAVQRRRGVVGQALVADDEIDAMNVSLTERCYDLLRREAPVASDLRFVVSVLRVLSELERIGDLALRVAQAGARPSAAGGQREPTFDILHHDGRSAPSSGTAQALRAWAAMDLGGATELAASVPAMDLYYDRLIGRGAPTGRTRRGAYRGHDLSRGPFARTDR